MDKKCVICDRKFVDKVKDKVKECVIHLPIFACTADMETVDHLGFICQDCHHEKSRMKLLRNRVERESKPVKKRKETK